MYSVSANLCCDEYGEYVEHWEGGDYDDYDLAYDRWNNWWPPEDEVIKAMQECDEHDGEQYHYNLQVGLWDEDGCDREFWNAEITVDDPSFW